MTESLIFRMPIVTHDENEIANDLDMGLKKVLSNNRTTIFQNSDMRLCVDENFVRVLLFEKGNTVLLEKLREYFYGEEYKRI